MSIAFSTIIIFLFVLPGLAFRRMYYTGEFSKQFFKSTAFDISILSIVPSIMLQLIGFNIIPLLTPITLNFIFFQYTIPALQIDFPVIGMLMLGKGDTDYFQQIFSNISEHFNQIALYNLVLVIFGGLSGFIARLFVRNLKLDRKLKILRFQNEWHYILSSEMLDFPKIKRKNRFNRKNQKLSAVVVDVLINTDNEELILYSGILEDYKLSKEGGLELVYLVNTFRRYLSKDNVKNENDGKVVHDDRVHDDRYYSMPKHYFIVKYEKVINLNVYYDFKDKAKHKFNLITLFQATLGLTYLGLIFYIAYNATNSVIFSIIITYLIVQVILAIPNRIKKNKKN